MSPPPTSIDGTEITGATIDGTDVTEITVDGDVVFTAVPPSGLARWEFEQDVTDSWGNNDGSLSGATFTTDSAVGSFALSFDGNDFVAINPLGFDWTSSWSVSVWSKSPSQSSAHVVSADDQNTGNRNWQLRRVSSEMSFRYPIAGSTNTLSVTIPNNVYQHFVITHSQSNGGRIYVDGNLEDSNSNTNNVGGTTELAIGNNIIRDEGFNGIADDVRMYSKELTASEVSNLYNTNSI
jgi:hypothetical protein